MLNPRKLAANVAFQCDDMAEKVRVLDMEQDLAEAKILVVVIFLVCFGIWFLA